MNNNVFVKIIDSLLCILGIVGVLFIGIWAYYRVTNNDLYTDFVATYVSSVTDNITNEKLPPFEANYFENYNNSGKEVIEFKINCYTDPTMPTVMSKGYQLVKDSDGKQTLYYADCYHGISWPSLHPYDEKNDDGQLKAGFYVSINDGDKDVVYGLRIDGQKVDTVKTEKWWSKTSITRFFGHWFSGNWSRDAEYNVKYVTSYFTMEDFMIDLAKSIKGCSYGTGDYTLPLVDMGKFWHLYDVDENGKMSDTPIGNDAGNVLTNSYFAIDVSYSRRGMSYAGQSMFGSVAGDSNFNMTGIDFDVDYWKANGVYNLTENDFEKRYSNIDSGFYYSLSESKLRELSNYKGIEIDIDFNISNLKNINVLGFDYYALSGLQIHNLTIRSDKQRDFNLLFGCLDKTGLTIEKVITNNVNLVDLGGNSGVAV